MKKTENFFDKLILLLLIIPTCLGIMENNPQLIAYALGELIIVIMFMLKKMMRIHFLINNPDILVNEIRGQRNRIKNLMDELKDK